jgi:hypothetical protein
MPEVVAPIKASVALVIAVATAVTLVIALATAVALLVIAVATAVALVTVATVALVVTAAIPIQARVKLTAIISVQFLDLLRLIPEQIKTMRLSFLQVIPPSQPMYLAVALAISMAAASMLELTIMELTKTMKACNYRTSVEHVSI